MLKFLNARHLPVTGRHFGEDCQNGGAMKVAWR